MPKARVLTPTYIGGLLYDTNSVVELDTKTLKDMTAAGAVDGDPSAVAYAQTLNVPLPAAPEPPAVPDAA